MIKWESCVIFALVISFLYSPLFASSAKEEAGLITYITYWAFDEGFGEVAKDKSGNGNDGKICGAKWVKVKNGFALSFDGVNDYVNCGNNPNLSFNKSAISIELCVKPNNLKEGATVLVNGVYKIRVGYKKGRVIMFIGGPDNFRYSRTGAVRKGYWTHIVYVRNEANLDCYIDGKLSNWYATTIPSSVNGSSYLTVGRAMEFSGVVDEVKIYNRALSAEEVIASYEQISLPTQRKYVIRFIMKFAKICFMVAMIMLVVIMRKFWLERKEIISESF